MGSPLLSADKLRYVYLELTSRCNLRCVYCPQSQSFFKDRVDFPRDRLPELIQDFKKGAIHYVRVSGIGETTILKDWMEICEAILSAGLDLEIVSNLAKKLSPEEIRMLCRFKRIYVSFDTTDSVVFAQLRRHASLDQVLDNLKQIVAFSKSQDEYKPYLLLSLVVNDKVIFQIEKTLFDAIELGIDEIFINDMRQYPDVEDALQVRPFWTLPLDQVHLGKRMLESAVASARGSGIITNVTPGLTQNIENAIQHPGEIKANENSFCSSIGSCTTPPGAGETRFCLDPWDAAVINADGSVSPCCLFPVVDGNIHDHTINEILAGDVAANLRHELLTGQLSTHCATCNLRGVTSLQELTKAVRSRLFANTKDLLPSIINPLVPTWKNKRVLIYGAGAHTSTLFNKTQIIEAHPIGIVDKNAQNLAPSMSGVPIYPIDAIESLNPDVIVISSFAYQEEIAQYLQQCVSTGIEIIKIYA